MNDPSKRWNSLRAVVLIGSALSGVAFAAPAPTSTAPEAGLLHAAPKARAEVERVLAGLVTAFNAHDLDAFVAYYADSADTTYIYQGQLLRGLPAIRSDYQRQFFGNDPGTRTSLTSTLQIALEHLNVAGPGCVIATAHVAVIDAAGTTPILHGMTTLILVRSHGDWRIAYDHSSTMDATAP